MAVHERDYRGAEPDRAAGRSLGWKLRRPLVPLAKWTLRRAAMVTASDRVRPDYLIIGGKRTGSTTLARSLLADPDVMVLTPAMADIKGTYFFDAHYDRGETWYRSHFPREQARTGLAARLGRPVVVGEASPYYLHHPHAPARAAAQAPAAKVICVVRDRVDRAHSHYHERRRQGIESIETFDRALEAEPDRLRGEWSKMLDRPDYVSLAHLNFGYVAQSNYGAALGRWIDAFGGDQVGVVHSQALFTRTTETLNKVRDFLGLHGSTIAPSLHFNRLARDTILQPQTRLGMEAAFQPDHRELARQIARCVVIAEPDDGSR